ncbi:hypothetical protein CHELA40_11682 [Chelatococcus asaccharovorans]|nr:hypothetical protein CHELA40_11682 [Chelatococcus asaccharovorans]
MVMTCAVTTSSIRSPRVSTSAIAWRTSSPTRSARWLGPGPVSNLFFGMFPNSRDRTGILATLVIRTRHITAGPGSRCDHIDARSARFWAPGSRPSRVPGE